MSIRFAGAASRGMVQLERSGHIERSACGSAAGSIHGKNTGPLVDATVRMFPCEDEPVGFEVEFELEDCEKTTGRDKVENMSVSSVREKCAGLSERFDKLQPGLYAAQ